MKKLLIIFLALFMADNAFARFNFSKAYAKAREHAYAEARERSMNVEAKEKSMRERLATSDIKPYGAPYHASKIVLDSLRMENYERLLKSAYFQQDAMEIDKEYDSLKASVDHLQKSHFNGTFESPLKKLPNNMQENAALVYRNYHVEFLP